MSTYPYIQGIALQNAGICQIRSVELKIACIGLTTCLSAVYLQ